MEANQQEKDTKKQQKSMILKMAKLREQYPEGASDTPYAQEPKRRLKQKLDSEDSTTFNGLEYFHRNKQTPPKQPTTTEIMFKTSLRERFENLDRITNIESMMHHEKYARLCELFKEVDEMLFFLKSKQKPTFLTFVSEQLYENKKIKVTQQHIQQILSVFPDAYQVSWAQNEKLLRIDKTDLFIQATLKTHIQLEERQQKFRQLLFDYIHANGEYISEASLPRLPSVKPRTPDPEKEEISRQLVSPADPRRTEIKAQISSTPTLSRLSQSLIEKLKLKQKLPILQTDHKPPVQQLIQVASMLHSYYRSRDVSNMFLKNVLKYGSDTLKSHMISEDQLKAYLNKLVEVCSFWIKIVENPNGQILRMDRSVEFPLIVQTLQS